MQLLSINVHVVFNGKSVLTSVCFVFISRRRNLDYVAVFSRLVDLIFYLHGAKDFWHSLHNYFVLRILGKFCYNITHFVLIFPHVTQNYA